MDSTKIDFLLTWTKQIYLEVLKDDIINNASMGTPNVQDTKAAHKYIRDALGMFYDEQEAYAVEMRDGVKEDAE